MAVVLESPFYIGQACVGRHSKACRSTCHVLKRGDSRFPSHTNRPPEFRYRWRARRIWLHFCCADLPQLDAFGRISIRKYGRSRGAKPSNIWSREPFNPSPRSGFASEKSPNVPLSSLECTLPGIEIDKRFRNTILSIPRMTTNIRHADYQPRHQRGK